MNLSARWIWFLGAGLVLVLFAATAKALPPSASAPAPAAHRGDPELQQKRRAFMKNAISLGLIAGIEDDSPITRVLAGQRFLSLSFEEKEEVLNVVWAYYKTEDPRKNVVLVVDQKSGKELGEYSPANGGLKMK